MSNNLTKPSNKVIGDLRDKEEKNIERAVRTESTKIAISIQLPEHTNEDLIKRAKDIYRFIEYGSIPMNKEQNAKYISKSYQFYKIFLETYILRYEVSIKKNICKKIRYL